MNAANGGCSKLIGTVLLIAKGYTTNIPSPVCIKPNSNRNRYSSRRSSFCSKILFCSGWSCGKISVRDKSHGTKVSVPQRLGHQGLGSDGLLPLLFVSRLCA